MGNKLFGFGTYLLPFAVVACLITLSWGGVKQLEAGIVASMVLLVIALLCLGLGWLGSRDRQ